MVIGPNHNLVNIVKPVYEQNLNLNPFKATLAYTAMAGNIKYIILNNDKP